MKLRVYKRTEERIMRASLTRNSKMFSENEENNLGGFQGYFLERKKSLVV
jgi:hypothetical protein